MNNKLDFIDIISVISFYIAIKNLEENEEQSKILQKELKSQDDTYLKIIKQNEEILEILKRR